eukprot:12842583-Alexandrium_andersonii.AAC.1
MTESGGVEGRSATQGLASWQSRSADQGRGPGTRPGGRRLLMPPAGPIQSAPRPGVRPAGEP